MTSSSANAQIWLQGEHSLLRCLILHLDLDSWEMMFSYHPGPSREPTVWRWCHVRHSIDLACWQSLTVCPLQAANHKVRSVVVGGSSSRSIITVFVVVFAPWLHLKHGNKTPVQTIKGNFPICENFVLLQLCNVGPWSSNEIIVNHIFWLTSVCRRTW